MREELWLARKKRIEACVKEGLTIAETAERLGHCPVTIRTYAERYSLPFPKLSKRDKNTVVQVRECSERGMTLAATAELVGVSYATINRIARSERIEFAKGYHYGDTNRADAMVSMYRAGKTLQQIGELFSISRERVRQIINKRSGIVGRDGGQAKAAADAKAARKAERERECQEKNGCSLKQLAYLRRLGRQHMKAGGSRYTTPIQAFCRQRSSARQRNIPWSLKLWEWWTIWQDSGNWEKRGRGGDCFVMCRFADAGGYEVGNVYIAPHIHNVTVQPNNPYRLGHPDHDKVWSDAAKRRGSRGCTIDGCGNKHYARGYCNRHYYHFVIKAPTPSKEGAAA